MEVGVKVEIFLKGNLDLIPSPSVKIKIMGGKVCLRCKGKTLLGFVSHTTTEEKCGMDFSLSSGEATSGEKKFAISHKWWSHG